ncbi:formate/nitrite transporter family protein [Clostridium sp. MSJ-4]|uniref:Formate/nitrite transporter family protein n=1 Tax=Clostridium simiarum TaxID=2841506 RepID=A0ABS6EXX1_9CLOT|nr:formate/nitrite transporter family protein [Clostridium simiarum]MBU5590499.1 formate/nitrite transporter family protein [Clostridium simiarum]
MFSEEINKISLAGEAKVRLMEKSKSRYILAAVLAGVFVGFGTLLIFTIGGLLAHVKAPYTKIVMGVSFGIALSLVIMAGSELFTGNNMVMTIATLNKKVTLNKSIKIWIYSFIGNLIGSIFIASLFVGAGLAKGATADFILNASQGKMDTGVIELLARGMLCNMLVCLAVWCSFKMKEESGKLIMIFWCLFAFITTGFEHSVANMTLLSISLMIPHAATITFGGFIYNLAIVTLGNFIGGAIFIGWAYYFISNK